MTDEAPEGSGALGAPEAPDPDEAQRAIEYCYDQGWSDGLPLVPVSKPLLDRFLATTDKEPDEIIGSLEQVGRDVDVRTAAINPRGGTAVRTSRFMSVQGICGNER